MPRSNSAISYSKAYLRVEVPGNCIGFGEMRCADLRLALPHLLAKVARYSWVFNSRRVEASWELNQPFEISVQSDLSPARVDTHLTTIVTK